MNINGYIQKYRNATFREMPFNEVDALVLSQLSYCHIEDYAPSLQDFETKPMPLKDLNDPKKTKKLIRGSIDAKLNAVMIKALASSRRYQNIGIAYCDVAFFE